MNKNRKTKHCCEYDTTLSNAIENKTPAQLPTAIAPESRTKSSLLYPNQQQ